MLSVGPCSVDKKKEIQYLIFTLLNIPGKDVLRLVTCNRLVNLGISKQQHLYLKTNNLI